MGQAIQVQAEQGSIGWAAQCFNPWQAGKKGTIPSWKQRFGSRDGGLKHLFQLFRVAAAHPSFEQLLASFVPGRALLTTKKILFCFAGSNRRVGKGKRWDDRVGLSTVPAAYPKDPHLLLVMVFEVVAVSSVAAFGPTSCTDYFSQH
jgi:hypothetical protein